MSLFNPFGHLIETKEYPLARFYRTSLWEKIKDTFYIFHGNINPDTPAEKGNPTYNQLRFGLFDYLTLGLFFPLNHGMIRLHNSDMLWKPLDFLLQIVTLAFDIPRLLFATVMTIVSLPFVAIAHAVSSGRRDRIERKIADYEIQDNNAGEVTIYYATSLLLGARPDLYKGCYVYNFDTNTLLAIDADGKVSEVSNKWRPAARAWVTEQTTINKQSFNNFDREKHCVKIMRKELNDSADVVHHLHLPGQLDKISTAKITITDADNIQLTVYSVEKTRSGKKQDKEYSISLHAGNQTDYRFFKNMQKLNVGGVQEQIEKENLQIDFRC